MNRVDRCVLITLAGLVVIESTLGWMMKSVAWVRAPLFIADTLVGMLLLAFALAIDPSDRERP